MPTTDPVAVLIVGGGPVGLALSIDLSWRGIPHLLLESEARAARARHPRMDQVGIRAMEHFRRLGITAAIEAAGFPRELGRDTAFVTAACGFELERDPLESDACRAPPPFSPQKHELCPQNFLDPALQFLAERSRLADIRYGCTLTGVRQEDDLLHCRAVEGSSGREFDVVARHVAGCDGSGSFMARHLAVAAQVRSTLTCSTNIFFTSPTLGARVAAPPAYRYLLVGPAGAWASLVHIDGRDRWRLQVLGDVDAPNWTAANACAAIDRALGAPVPYTLESTVPWVRRELVVDRFSDGRCFLVGDAAHQFSPTGGYGMSTGLDDAFNLAWKLAAVVDGWGGPSLLASYEAERRPVALRNAQRATLNFQRMRAARGHPLLADDSAAGAAARREAGAAIRAGMSEEWASMGIHLGYSYGRSPIVWPEAEPAPDADPARYVPIARTGLRAPHAWMRDQRSTLDLFGRGFVLLRIVDPDDAEDADHADVATAELARVLDAARCRRMPLDHLRIDDPAIARLYGARWVLVRPDGHVAFAAGQLPDEPEVLIDRVRGALE